MQIRKFWPVLLILLLLSACASAEEPDTSGTSSSPHQSGTMFPAEETTALPDFTLHGVLEMNAFGALLFTDQNGALYQADETASQPVFVLDGIVSFGSNGASHWAIATNGGLYTWGSNQNGALGHGTKGDSAPPQKILENVVSAGVSWAIQTNGDLYLWGASSPGLPGEEPLLSPQKFLDNVVFYEDSLAVTDDGGLFIWGRDFTASRAEWENGATLAAPTRIAEQVAKAYPPYILQKDGSLHTWTGQNTYPYGQGAEPSWNALESHKIKVLDGVKTLDFLADGSGYLALLENGDVYTWGIGDCVPGFGTHGEPRRMAKKFSEATEAFAPGYALTEDGNLYGWGMAQGERICDETPNNNGEPALLLPNVQTFFPGNGTDFAALTKDGTLFLRPAMASDAEIVPEMVPVLTEVTQISVVDGYGNAQTADGRLFAWSAVSAPHLVLENVLRYKSFGSRLMAVTEDFLWLVSAGEPQKIARLS